MNTSSVVFALEKPIGVDRPRPNDRMGSRGDSWNTPLLQQPLTSHVSPDLIITAAEPDFAHQFGRTPAQTCGRSLLELLHPLSVTVLSKRFAALAEERVNRFVERVSGVEASGRVFRGELTAIAVKDTGTGLAGIIVFLHPDKPPPDTVESAAKEEPATDSHPQLSKIDAAILEGIAAGASTLQLAARLYLSRQGVDYHVGLMLRRLQAPNRAALVARAHALGMFREGRWPPLILPKFIE
ncbi:LuxR C-terminal-related transcriptional regulator [Streptomyces sp. NPDC051913]|uniref:helix-turn-helix transcriptional regulator n=1 Tax=Streptomyces sp. NPDC051913 TaxID=3365676 RepID=UPI0037D6631B